MKTVEKISRTKNPAVLGLAMVAGLGMTLMIISLGAGVIGGSSADSSAIGMGFIVGLALFIVGAGGWFAVVQPHKHFDDINVPMDQGHHGHHEDSHLATTETHGDQIQTAH